MANQAEAMEPINFEQLEGEKFFNQAWKRPFPPQDCSLEMRSLWLQVAAYRGIYEKGGYSKEDGVKLRIAVAKKYVTLKKEEEERKNVLKAFSMLNFSEDSFIGDLAKKFMNDFRTIKINWK